MNNQEFGTFISSLRKEKGLTQLALAEQLHISDKAVSRWENGKNYPDIEILEPLAKALDVSISELIACKKIESNEAAILSMTEQVYINEMRKNKKKKRIIIFISVLLAVLLILLISYPFAHQYGDNLYDKFVFRDSSVVQVNENLYRVPRDHPEAFRNYLTEQGWYFKDQLGSMYIFEKDGKEMNCRLRYKFLYAVYEISYGSPSRRTINQLKEDCPQYFMESAEQGVEIYVWQMAENHFRCGALPVTDREKTAEELAELGFHSVSVEEMKGILSYCNIPLSKCTVIPTAQPISSYLYPLDDAYNETVQQLFD